MDMKILAMVKPYQKLSVYDNRLALEGFCGERHDVTNAAVVGEVDDGSSSGSVGGGGGGVTDPHAPQDPTSTWSAVTNGLWRFFGNQKRRNVLQKLRQRVTEFENYVRNDLVREEWVRRELAEVHPRAVRGVHNLQLTYQSDSQTYVHLDVIARRLQSVFENFVISPQTPP